MNCRAFRKQAVIAFKQSGYEISGELLEHANSCRRCSDYLKELKLLQETLNKPRLEVLPGELDDLSFDQIAATSSDRIRTTEARPIRIARPVKWLLAPVVVAAAAMLIIMLAKPVGQNVNNYSSISVDPYSNLVIDNALFSSDSLSISVLSSMASGDKDLDRAADELLSNSDVDDMLSSLSQSELKALYDKIDNLKG